LNDRADGKYIVRLATCLLLAGLCAASFLIVFPTLNQNTKDPNLIAYHDSDEAYLMDLAWYYYSGEKRESFQYDGDYGVELWYLADFAKLVLSRFMTVTPVTFVIILRWLHLLAWVSAILALWYFVHYHFGKTWQPLVAAALMATNPAFAYLFSSNLKPDPIVLFFVIMGLHYALKMTENYSKRFLIIAAAFAAAAFTIKYFGVFLLPPIVIALYCAARCKENARRAFSPLRFGWVFPGACGLLCMMMALSMIFMYKRRLTGLTWYESVGIWQSFAQNRLVLYIVLFGASLVFLSLILWAFDRNRAGHIGRIASTINELNSYSLITLGLFLFFCVVFGFKWIVYPQHFISMYAQGGRDAFGYEGNASLPGTIASTVTHAPESHGCKPVDEWPSVRGSAPRNPEREGAAGVPPKAGPPSAENQRGSTLGSFILGKVREFNTVIFVLFITYLIVEFATRRKSLEEDRALIHKRLVLVAFILPFFPYMFSGGRAAPHHMLPFFAAAVVLSLEGIRMIFESLKGAGSRRAFAAFIGIVLAICVLRDFKESFGKFAYERRYKEDIMFDVARWWQKNCPHESKIVADHPTRVYLPPEYKNVRYFKFGKDRVGQIRSLLASCRPNYLYYNTYGEGVPPLEAIVPGVRARLVASFESAGRRYQRYPGAHYLIYEITGYE